MKFTDHSLGFVLFVGDGCTSLICKSGGTCYDGEDPYGLGYYCACPV